MGTEVDLSQPTAREIVEGLSGVIDKGNRRKGWSELSRSVRNGAFVVGSIFAAGSFEGVHDKGNAITSVACFIVANCAERVHQKLSQPDPNFETAQHVMESLRDRVGYGQVPRNGEGIG